MSSAPQEIRFCKSRDGTRIAYAVSGEGPVLVWAQHWVHHLEHDAAHPVWRHWIEFLQARNTLVRFDWRGCGLSDRAPRDFGFERLAEDFEAVAAAAGAGPVALFGMAGAGGAVAMRYAARHPERVARLALHNCHRRGRLAGEVSADEAQEAEARLKVIELGWRKDTPAYEQFFTALHMPDAPAAHMRSYEELLRKSASAASVVALLRTFWHADVSGIVAQVACPALVSHVRGDCVIPFEEGRSVAAAIRAARFVPLESRNHLLLPDEPAWSELTGAMERFLAADAEPAARIEALTGREREVLELLAQGLPNKAIGARLGISEATARNHVSAILAKMGVKSRAEAIVRARHSGATGNR
jgi:DNA-binding NarL/FixJ family response regulator